MSKEKLSIDEAYTCPRCGGQEVVVEGMEQIFEDARSESVRCLKCASSWRVYYKMTELNTKVTNISDIPLFEDIATDDVTVTPEQPVAEE